MIISKPLKKQIRMSKKCNFLDPAGKRFDQKMAEEFSKEEHLVFICGHYEGYDERIRTLVTDEVFRRLCLDWGRTWRNGHDRCNSRLCQMC